MSGNELVHGEPRVGWLVDGNPHTPHVGVTLVYDLKRGIELTVPFQSGDYYSRWFLPQPVFPEGAPEKVAQTHALPQTLMFQDSRGNVILVGCQDNGFQSNFALGSGRVRPSYAILGGQDLRFNNIAKMATVIPGLADWLDVHTTSVQWESDEQGRTSSFTARAEPGDPIPLGGEGDITLRPSFSATSANMNRDISVRGQVRVETKWPAPESWQRHNAIHTSILDLLTVASWRTHGFAEVWVTGNQSATAEVADGEPVWLRVIAPSLPADPKRTTRPGYLFTATHVGVSGIRSWLSLHRSERRIIDPLLILCQATGSPESMYVQSCMALEALGYRLAAPEQLNNRGQLDFRAAMALVAGAVGPAGPIADTERWVANNTNVYREVKHPEHDYPDGLTILNLLTENITVLRCWVALELGVHPTVLGQNLQHDQQSLTQYEARE